jgi:hypothetical protein
VTILWQFQYKVSGKMWSMFMSYSDARQSSRGNHDVWRLHQARIVVREAEMWC